MAWTIIYAGDHAGAQGGLVGDLVAMVGADGGGGPGAGPRGGGMWCCRLPGAPGWASQLRGTPIRRVRGQRAVKIGCLVAGMAVGAGSIDDMDLLRHGAMTGLFGDPRAVHAGLVPARLHLGNARQAEKAQRLFLAELACRSQCCPRRTCRRPPGRA